MLCPSKMASSNQFLPVKQTSDRCVSWQHWVETLQTPRTEGRIHRLSANVKFHFVFRKGTTGPHVTLT